MRYSLIILLLSLMSTGFSQSSGGRIIEYAQHATVEPGLLRNEISYLIEVNNKESNWLGDIRIYHDEGDKYKLEEAVLLDKWFSTIRKIKKKDVVTVRAGSRGTFFDDRLVDKFSIKHDVYPYYVKYRYTIESKDFLYLSYWIPRIYSSIPVVNAKLTVTRPEDYQIAIDSIGQFDYKKHSSAENPGTITETWSVKFPENVKNEPFSPPAKESLQQIKIIPIQFSYGVSGAQDSWENFGEWISRLNSGLDELPPMETAKIKTKFGHLKDTLVLIRSLYNYLQDNTRYINVALDIGGLKSYPASYVSVNHYGDCKALTMYMKAMLKAFDIPSFYTIIKAGPNPQRINTNFPSQQFNHVILCVPFGSDTIWLENTASSYPFNYLGTSTQGRTALLCDGEQSRLIHTPSLTMEDVEVSNIFNIELSESSLAGTMEIKAKGDDFESLAYVAKFYNSKDQQSYFRSVFGSWNAQFANPKITIPDRNVNFGMLSAEVNFQQSVRKVGNKIILINLPTQAREITSDDFKGRSRPIRISEPINDVDSIYIDITGIPEGYTFQPIEQKSISFEHGTYHFSQSYSDSKILIIRSLEINPNESNVLNQPNYYAFFESIENEEKKPLLFKKE